LKNEIRQAIEGINEASRKGDIETLKGFCYKDMVIVPPGFVQRAGGRDTYLKSVDNFCSTGTVLEYKEQSSKIDAFGDVLIVRIQEYSSNVQQIKYSTCPVNS
jgi:ketosteroid isomerase-like protein